MVRRFVLLVVLLLAFVASLSAQSADFAPLEQWRSALESGDQAKLAALYSKQPPAALKTEKGDQPAADAELAFWGDLHKQGLRKLRYEIRKSEQQQGLQIVSLQTIFTLDTPAGPRNRYVLYQQAWQQQGGNWAIIGLAHSEVIKIHQPKALNPKLYDEKANAAEEIKHELADAAKTHRRLILVFGGNWCYDCHVLDGALHEPDVAPLVETNFIVVHVDIGHGEEKNRDIARKYNTPLDKGVPALAVLDSDGKLLYSQQNGEFEAARNMDPDDLIAFLNKWKP